MYVGKKKGSQEETPEEQGRWGRKRGPEDVLNCRRAKEGRVEGKDKRARGKGGRENLKKCPYTGGRRG